MSFEGAPQLETPVDPTALIENVIDARPAIIQQIAQMETPEDHLGREAADRILARLALCEGDRSAERRMLNSLPRDEVDAAQVFVLAQIEQQGDVDGSPYGYSLLTRLNESVLWRPRQDYINRQARPQDGAIDLR